MKKKKEFEIFVYGALIFIILLFVIAQAFNNKFNPETDVCNEWECQKYVGCINSCMINKYEFHKGQCTTDETSNEYKQVCKEWRSKNKCELDANAEGCVCDEYSKIKIQGEVNGSELYLLSSMTIPNESDWQIDVDFTPTMTMEGITTTAKCKDNVCYFYYVSPTYNYYLKDTDICIKSHLRTIQDYSCAELKKALLLNEQICIPCPNQWLGCEGDRTRKAKCYSLPQIYDIAISRGCDI